MAVLVLFIEGEDLWAGTEVGVFRVNLRTHTSALSLDTRSVGRANQSFYAGRVTKLLSLGCGRLWASTGNGQFYYDGQAWAEIPLSATLRSSSIMGVDQNGDVILQSYDSQRRTQLYFRLPGHAPPTDHTWVAVPAALSTYRGAEDCEWQAFSDNPSHSYNLPFHSSQECLVLKWARQQFTNVFGLGPRAVLDRDGSIWGAGSQQLGHLVGTVPSLVALPVERVYAIVPDPQHGVWLGTDKGLIYSDGQSVRLTSLGMEECSLPSLSDRGLSVDSTGTAWLSAGNTVYNLPPGQVVWRPFSAPSNADLVHVQASAAGGGVWATSGKELFLLGGVLTTTRIVPPDLQYYGINGLVADSRSVWAWNESGLISKKCNPLQFIVSTGSWVCHQPSTSRVAQVVIGSDSMVYAGGPDGLYAYAGSEWSRVVQQDVSVAAADRQGGVWIASREQGRLWYYKAHQLTPHGQPFDKGVSQGVTGLTVDNRNHLWAAMFNSSILLLYDGATWRRIGAPLRLGRITSDPDGRIWVAGWDIGGNGVAVYDPSADKQP